jgi:hypothetical protein
MRRSEFDSQDPQVIRDILTANKIGRVGIITPDGYPRIVPVNYVAIDTHIFFHGAPEGEKYEAFARGDKVSFAVDIPYSTIPSYWFEERNACPATIFYKSLFMRGTGKILEDPDEKANALQALMESEQPEGGYARIVADDPIYLRRLRGVAVFEIIPNAIDVKLKFGQNRSREVRVRIVKLLRERAGPRDEETAVEIEKTLG